MLLQVLQWVMSYDNENATEALAITAASAALAVSGQRQISHRGGRCSQEHASHTDMLEHRSVNVKLWACAWLAVAG